MYALIFRMTPPFEKARRAKGDHLHDIQDKKVK
jgi:hypothetical protein